jgi:hypothetical protein
MSMGHGLRLSMFSGNLHSHAKKFGMRGEIRQQIFQKNIKANSVFLRHAQQTLLHLDNELLSARTLGGVTHVRYWRAEEFGTD